MRRALDELSSGMPESRTNQVKTWWEPGMILRQPVNHRPNYVPPRAKTAPTKRLRTRFMEPAFDHIQSRTGLQGEVARESRGIVSTKETNSFWEHLPSPPEEGGMSSLGLTVVLSGLERYRVTLFPALLFNLLWLWVLHFVWIFPTKFSPGLYRCSHIFCLSRGLQRFSSCPKLSSWIVGQ
jgi:hypothetical protein